MDSQKILYIAAIAAFLVPVSNTIYNPNIAIIQKDFNTSYTLIAATISAFTAVMAISQLVYGPISDRIGRKKVLIPGLIVYIVANILIYFSWDIYSLILFRILQAMGISTAIVIGAAIISDVYPRKMRGRAMGTYMFVLLIGPTIGPIIGGIIADTFGWRSLFIFLTFLGISVGSLVYKMLPETLKKPHKSHMLAGLNLLRDGKIAIICLLGSSIFASIYIFTTFLPVLFHEKYGLTSTQIGLAYLPSGIALLAGSYIGGRLSDKIGRKPVFMAGTIINLIAVFLFAFSALYDAGIYFLILLFSLVGLGSGLFFPSSRVYILDRTQLSASANGVYNFALFTAATISPIAGGIVLERFSYFSMFILMAFLMLATSIVALKKT